MSFPIILQRNYSEKNRLIKYTEDIATVEGTLKEGTSIITPTILIGGTLFYDMTQCNYFTIAPFNRRYFVTDITKVSNSLITVSGRSDVLSSFSSQFLDCRCIVKRQENTYNLYLDDGSIKTYSSPIVSAQRFPNAMEQDSIILLTQGGNT